MSKLYIAVMEDFPDHMVPVLVAHAVLRHHLSHHDEEPYADWLESSFRKVVVKVNAKEFDKISKLYGCTLSHENSTLGGRESCAVWTYDGLLEIPNVLKYSKLWKPNETLRNPT